MILEAPKMILTRVFPKTCDNRYRGHWLGLVIFVAVMAVKALQGIKSILDTRNTAINADGIPLPSFPPAAVEEIVSMFALLGLYLLIIPMLSVVILIRWRSLIPLMYLLFLAFQVASRVVIALNTASAQSGHPIGYYINIAILAVTALGFLLSIVGSRYTENSGSTSP